MKNEREPRWKQLAHSQEKCRDKSRVSHRSSKYNPKKSHSGSEKQFSLHMRNNSLNSDNAVYRSSSIPLKTSEADRSVVMGRPKRQGSQVSHRSPNKGLQSGGGSSLDHAASSFYPKVVDVIQSPKRKPKQNEKMFKDPEESSNKMGDFQIKIDPKLSSEENFRECLRNMQKAERDLIVQRNQIQKMLAQQQETFVKTKLRIFQSFKDKSSVFEDQSLKRLIEKFIGKTKKQEPKKMYRITNEGKFTNELSNIEDRRSRESSMIRPTKSSQRLEKLVSPSTRNNTAFKQNFGRILTVINSLKQGIEQCKHIRQSKAIL